MLALGNYYDHFFLAGVNSGKRLRCDKGGVFSLFEIHSLH